MPDGVVTIEGDRIVAVGENVLGTRPRDLGNVAILPGLVNTHAHLEFSNLDRPLKGCEETGLASGPCLEKVENNGLSRAPVPISSQPLSNAPVTLPEWIKAVIEYRRMRDAGTSIGSPGTEDRDTAIRHGLSESISAGTTLLSEIATADWPQSPVADSPVDCAVFLELIGLTADRAAPLLDAARRHVRRGLSSAARWRPGISPHAPYSVHPQVVARVAELSAAMQFPVAMHLAESREELDLLSSHHGPFLQLLKELQVWDPTAVVRGTRVLDYLQMLSGAHRALVIHGNYLDREEVELLARHDNMSVVYCPRTHAYFRHDPYPLSKRLAAGINVALGTDSRASNPDLSVLEEMRFVARHHAGVAPEQILRMGTLSGAEALGCGAEAGSLEPGKRADLATVGLPDVGTEDPYESVLGFGGPVKSVYCGGRELTVG